MLLVKSLDLSVLTQNNERVFASRTASDLIIPPDICLNNLAEAVAFELGADQASITFVLDEHVEVKGKFGWEDNEFGDISTIKIKDSICSYVAALDQPVEFIDPIKELGIDRCANADKVSYYAGVPLHFESQVIGAIAVFDKPESNGSHKDRVFEVLRLYAKVIETEIAMRHAR